MPISKRTFVSGAIALAVAAGASAGAPTGAPAGRIHIANDGVDADGCGTRTAPCRTIGRGMSLAAAGDTILVGPGVYGDVNRDGDTGGDDEERPAAGSSLRIAKPLKILSTHGAASTTIVGFDDIVTTLEIDSDGVTFGSPRQGFTIVVSHFDGLSVRIRTNVRIAGNIITGARRTGMSVSTSGTAEVSDNEVHGNLGDGIAISNLSNEAGVTVRRNRVYSNGKGITVQVYGPNEISFNEVSNNAADGILLSHTPVLVYRNIVTSNWRGITVNGWSISHPPSAGPLIVRNTVVGSRDVAVYFNGGPVLPELRSNNLYGNGLEQSELFDNCAFANYSGSPVNATGTYWGAVTGPGADPADQVCGPNPVVTTPFATRPN
jgi:hypothetical protein